MRTTTIAAALLALGVALGPARAEVPEGPPTFTNPLDIDNTYNPFVTFRIRLYEVKQGHTDGFAIDVFRPETRTFKVGNAKVECACMEEWAVEDGEVVEISRNYFAQADDGTVYYFGEVVDNYEGGVIVDHGGSWLVGGPKGGDPAETAEAEEPAVFMPANPEVGDVWKPEDLPEAGIEEFVEAIAFQQTVQVPQGKHSNALEVREETPDVEYKWYGPGVGFLRGKDANETLALIDLVDAGDEDGLDEALEEILDSILDG